MNIKYVTQKKTDAQAGFIFLFEDMTDGLEKVAENFTWLKDDPAIKDFSAKNGEITVCYPPSDISLNRENLNDIAAAPARIIVVGLGKKDDFTLNRLRMGMGFAIQKCGALKINNFLLPKSALANLPGSPDRLLEECVYSACLAVDNLQSAAKFKTDKKSENWSPEDFIIWDDANKDADNEDKPAQEHMNTIISRAENSFLAVKITRELANMPPNQLYPEIMALKASELSVKYNFSCEVLNAERLNENGLGCLLGVGQGSTRKPRLIILDTKPDSGEKPLILVGKGITFDSGGLCLKPPLNMSQMKCDMTGAAAVLAVLAMAAKENLAPRIIGLLSCAENMPDGGAFRPGDVLTCANNETVEVINTDAEGRLALCDALIYAQQKWKPKLIIDIATLTGACAVALGNEIAGLFCNDDALRERIVSFGSIAGENYWHLPLYKNYESQLESNVADIKNTGKGREGGAITAALFLKHFINNDLPWAHLDIAGVDWNDAQTPLCSIGASGFGARTLLEFCRGDFE